MKVAKASVDYRKAPGEKRCFTCSMFSPPDDCSHVRGEIDPGYLCNDWAKRSPVVMLVRHGSTAHNRGGPGKDRLRGHADVPMTEKGVFEVNRTADILSGCPLAVIHASNLTRAIRAASLIAAKQAERPHIKPSGKLRTWKLGPELEGATTTPAVVERIKSLVRRPGQAPPGGESFAAFTARVIGAAAPIFAKAAKEGGEIAIVAHGRVAQVLDLWVKAGCDEAKIDPRDLLNAPDTLPPGGAMKYAYKGKRWAGEIVPGTAPDRKAHGSVVS